MKKQESSKKTAKWLIPVLALVLVAIVGVAAFLAFGGGDSQGNETPVTTPTGPAADEGLVLYWNVDRMSYVGQGVDNNSSRMPRSDGFYYIRFAVNGEQIDLPVRDKTLVDRIDMVDIMALILDEDGVVVDMQTVNECAGGLIAPALYVESIEGNTVHTKTNGNFGGLAVDLEITEDVKIYDVGGVGLLVGIPGQIKVDDELIAVKDKEGKLIYVFVKAYEAPADVYWNIHRKYNSTTKTTTREPSVTGVYEFLMALNGELVTVRTRDYEVAKKMDSFASKCQFLEFNEDGYVISATQSSSMMKTSGTWGSWAHVLEVNGDYVVAEKLSGDKMGTVYEGIITEDTKVIDVSSAGGYSGAYTKLRVGDQVHGLLDRRGRLAYVFVHSRLVDCDLFWNCERKYDSTNKVSTRLPAADGYYYFDVATGGKQMKVRTKDKELANSIDVSYAARCFGLELDGDEIVKIHSAGTIHGGSTFGSWYYVDKLEGNKITVKRILTGDTVPTYQEGVLADDVEIINGSTNFTSHCGEYSKLSVGDRVHCLKNLKGEIRVVFIVEKPVDCPVYWNITRMYNSTTKQTTRVPDEDGYYVFKMAVDGKQVKLKTKDKAIATKIDSNAARCYGLEVYNGIIYKVHTVTSVRGLSGGTKSISWVDVTRVGGGSFTAQKNSAGHKDDGKQFTSTIGWGCKIINTTSGVKSHIGEYTDLRVGDRVHVLHDGDGNAKVIFVVDGRQAELNTEKEDCPCAQNPTWEPWDGTTPMRDGKFYYLTQDVQAPTEGFLMEGMTVALRLDGHTISSDGRCFYVKSGGQLSVCDHVGGGKLIGTGITGEAGGVIRMYTNASEAYVKLWNLELTGDNTDDKVANQGGIISASGIISLFNCNIHDGVSSSTGGNFHINPSGVLRLFDSTVSGGVASTNGGNIHINNGGFYVENVTVIDGKSGNKSDNFNISSDKEMKINGLTLINSDAKGGSGMNFSKGTVGIAGNIQIHENGKNNLIMGAEAVFVNEGLDAASKIIVQAGEQDLLTGANTDLSGCFESYDAKDYVVAYDAQNKKVTFDCIIVPQTHENDHCACAGLGAIGDHTCATLTGWTEITADVFETAMGTNNASQGVKFINDGNYYLTLDYVLPSQLCIMPGQNITICLNGCDLTRTGTRAVMCAGTLNITDCKGTGTVSGADTANGGTIKTVSGSVLNLFAGTLTCDSVADAGAVVNVTQDKGNIADPSSTAPSVFNMYGGTIRDGVSKASGGNVNIWHSATVNMYGGTVSGGTATVNGGNISVGGSGATLNMYGGTVTGGTAENGDGICLNQGFVTVANDANVSGNNGADIFILKGGPINFQNYTTTDVVSLGMTGPGVFAKVDTDISAYFESADPDLTVNYKDGQLKLGLSSTAQGHIHCECGDTAQGLYAHTCENSLYEEWTSGDSLPTSGYWYLTQDVKLETCHKVEANNLNICLNGYSITCENSRLFWLNNIASALTVTSCKDGGKLGAAGVSGESGGVIRNSHATSSASFYNLSMTRIDDSANRVAVTEGGLVMNSGILNMYNVTATNGFANKASGLQLALTSKAVIVNCTISGCTTLAERGANINLSGNNSSDKAQLTIIDSTVTGGSSAAATGKDVSLNTASNNIMYVGGKVTVGDLYMTGTGNLNVLDEIGLDAESSIGVSMAANGKIGSSATDTSACFRPADSTLTVVYDATAKTLTLKKPALAHVAHCICGGKAVGVGDHICETVSDWTEISADVFTTAMGTDGKSQGVQFLESGNYYLTDDYALTSQLCIMPGQKITVCLNGYSLYRNGGRTIMCAGELNVTDCKDGGTVKSNVSNANCATVKIVKGGHMALFGGTLSNSGTKNSAMGGILGVSKDSGYITDSTEGSSFTMYGGTISGGKTGDHGGNIVAWSAVDVTIYGGTISGGQADTYGGNISYTGSGTLKILGGSFIGGSAVNGGNIRVSGGTLILGGNVSITGGDLYLAKNKEITINSLTNTDPIPLTMELPGVFATNVTSDFSGKFQSTDTGYEVRYDADQKTLSLLPAAGAAHEDHCVCGGSAQGVADHAECEDLTWIPITQALSENGMSASTVDFAKLPSGNYYLDANINVSYAEYIGGDKDGVTTPVNLNLCLNGKKITTSDTKTYRVFGRIYDGSSVSLCDCSGEQDTEGTWTWDGTIVGGKAANGPILYTYEKGVVNVYGGNFVGPENHTTTGTGLFSIAMDKGEDTNIRDNAAVMNLYNGNLVAGPANKGAAIMVMHAATLNMYGGTVTGNTTVGNGGAITGDAGTTLNLLGGKVIDGTAGGSGDGVYANATSSNFADVTVGGDFQGNVTLAKNVKIKIQDLTGTVGIEMVEPGVFAENVETDVSDYFNAIGAYKIVYDATAKTLGLVEAVHENHCICEGAEVASIQGHTCENVTWTALTQAMFDAPDGETVTDGTGYTLKDGGHYYIKEAITLTKPLTVAAGEQISLCLNGNTLSGASCRALDLSGTLNLCDCQTTAGTLKGSLNDSGATMNTAIGSTLNLYGGNIQGFTITASGKTAGTGTVNGNLNMYGGKILGGTATGNGGNLIIANGAVVTMYGGTITGGRTPDNKSGGNIRIDKGSFIMYGGTLSGGYAKEGGNLNIGANGRAELYGGVIEGGTGASAGGNIAVFSDLIIDGTTIRNGVAQSTTTAGGGNIYGFKNKVNIQIKSGTVTGGKAKNGANIFLSTDSSTNVKLTVTGGTVSGVAEGAAGKSIQWTTGSVTATVGGTAQVDEICLNGQKLKIHADGFQSGAAIGVSMVSAGVFADISGTYDYTQVFTSADAAYRVDQTATQLKLTAK